MKKRYTEEQIIRVIKEYDAGAKVSDICRRMGISNGTFITGTVKLQVHTKRRKNLTRPLSSMLVPSSTNQRWSMDFVSDQLATGRRFCVLNVVDDYRREVIGQLVLYQSLAHK